MEWLRYKHGKPMLFGSAMYKMPAEWWRVFCYCLQSEETDDSSVIENLVKLHAQLDREAGLR